LAHPVYITSRAKNQNPQYLGSVLFGLFYLFCFRVRVRLSEKWAF